MNQPSHYHIGSIGQPWSSDEKAQWHTQQQVKRSYAQQVLASLKDCSSSLEKIQYGTLQYTQTDYPLMVLKSTHWKADRPNILITGGVHGYETSGVHGALHFATEEIKAYQDSFNFIIVPCVSPWGYETINRWNPQAIDPNRSFYKNSPASEARQLMDYLASLAVEFMLHIDLHETTDTDNSEFRPALMARDAIDIKYSEIPDGFYLVGDSQKPQPDFQKSIIERVQQVTHIAPCDEAQCLIGVPLAQFGVVNYEARQLGLCMGVTEAPYVTTTEVYPDSVNTDDNNCMLAQVSVICAGLDYLSHIHPSVKSPREPK